MSDGKAEFESLLTEALGQLDFVLDADQRAVLYRHYTLLKQWNEKMSLTSIRGLSAVVFRHFGESLAVAKTVGPGVASVVDIGSGSGFPGIPVAVSWPGCDVVLVESSGKKATFLKEVARMVKNVRVHHGRFEAFDRVTDCATVRAVAGDGVARRVRELASRVVVLGSAHRAGEVAKTLGLVSVERLPIPWDFRTMVVSGQVSRGTRTS